MSVNAPLLSVEDVSVSLPTRNQSLAEATRC